MCLKCELKCEYKCECEIDVKNCQIDASGNADAGRRVNLNVERMWENVLM